MRMQEKSNHFHALGEGEDSDEPDYDEDKLDGTRTPKVFTELKHRLKQVDWEKIIRAGKPYEDENFEAELNSIFDKNISEYYESGDLILKR